MAGLKQLVADLNALYKSREALHTTDCAGEGFEWIDCDDAERSVLSFYRYTEDHAQELAIVCNFTPIPHHGYRVGVNHGGEWIELLNSDAEIYGGSGQGNYGSIVASDVSWHNRPNSLELTLPPLSVLVLSRD